MALLMQISITQDTKLCRHMVSSKYIYGTYIPVEVIGCNETAVSMWRIMNNINLDCTTVYDDTYDDVSLMCN